ncbi:MAG: sigma-70 family RNA polymerase sigma factor [Acidobacteria bacterium]|nr:sigma-70 family RNA polymerase sigma factor [Acidobacteriota bacterium]
MNLAEALRIEGGRILATLIRYTGDFHLAEDALQEATVVALERWSDDDPPPNPGAWLMTTARNKALDRLRREAKRSAKEEEAMRLLDEAPPPPDDRDDRLRLLFTCCHPAIAPVSQIALALRTICGLSTDEIARVFLVKTPTMAQRISRTKAKIADAHITYRVPDDHELPERLIPVLVTVYAVFTAGHHAPTGRFDARVDLADEGIRLARLLTELMPDEPECWGLLALTLATNARRGGRLDESGDMVLLADQDRSRWDDAAIAEAGEILDRQQSRRLPGPFQIQAAIACLHGFAPSYAETDWQEISELYRTLEAMQPTVVVRVNRAIAEAEMHGPEAALALLDDVDSGWHYLWVARSDLQRRLGQTSEASRSLHRALAAEMNDSDRALLERRLAELSA